MQSLSNTCVSGAPVEINSRTWLSPTNRVCAVSDFCRYKRISFLHRYPTTIPTLVPPHAQIDWAVPHVEFLYSIPPSCGQSGASFPLNARKNALPRTAHFIQLFAHDMRRGKECLFTFIHVPPARTGFRSQKIRMARGRTDRWQSVHEVGFTLRRSLAFTCKNEDEDKSHEEDQPDNGNQDGVSMMRDECEHLPSITGG